MTPRVFVVESGMLCSTHVYLRMIIATDTLRVSRIATDCLIVPADSSLAFGQNAVGNTTITETVCNRWFIRWSIKPFHRHSQGNVCSLSVSTGTIEET